MRQPFSELLLSKGSDIMKLVSKIVFIILAFAILVPGNVYAENIDYIESFIDGDQDYIVFGTIMEIDEDGNGVILVSEIVGNYNEAPADADETDRSEFDEEAENEADTSGVLEHGSEIPVVNFTSYLYYDSDRCSPRVGNNVLLSLKFGGNVYMIENGAFLVTDADYDSFMIKAPDNISAEGMAEITAIYNYVKSNGRNSDLSIRDGNVYTHEAGAEKELDVPMGIEFTNQSGETVGSSVPIQDGAEKKTKQFRLPGEKWMHALVIMVVGAVLGIVITKAFIKIEKKVDKQ